MTTPAPALKRLQCERCLRAQSSCICHWICALTPACEVLVLQHPLEVQQAKGSGRLLHLSLAGSRVVVGEQFDASTLNELLFAPWDQAEEVAQPLLLYPETTPMAGTDMTALTPAGTRRRLVILDATWRKSRKMLYLNPGLQQLPRLSLQQPPASHYRIRKAHRPEQLSTLEATCHALTQLEGAADKYLPLLQAFDGFVGQQAAYVPPRS
jgi:DTW domain-containing protein YfiP